MKIEKNNSREDSLYVLCHRCCFVLSCFFRVHPRRAFSGACRSRPTLYRAEHHTPMGRVLRSYALEPSRGIVAGLTLCLVLSCFFRVHPLGGLFLAHAEAGLHCTVQSITTPWAGYSGRMHLSHLGALLRILHSALSCLVSLECTLWEVFFWRMPKQAYTVPCRASHPHGQGAQVVCT